MSIYRDLVMLLQSENLYVYTAVIHDTLGKSNATYVTIWITNDNISDKYPEYIHS